MNCALCFKFYINGSITSFLLNNVFEIIYNSTQIPFIHFCYTVLPYRNIQFTYSPVDENFGYFQN